MVVKRKLKKSNDENEGEIPHSSLFKRIFHKAVRICSYREHSEVELKKKLSQFPFPTPIIDEVITKLIELDLQSNQRYKEAMIRHLTKKNLSKNAIIMSLRKHHIDCHVHEIEEVLSEYGLNPEKFILQKIATKIKLNQSDEQIVRYLVNKGHPVSTINRLLKESRQKE